MCKSVNGYIIHPLEQLLMIISNVEVKVGKLKLFQQCTFYVAPVYLVRVKCLHFQAHQFALSLRVVFLFFMSSNCVIEG